MNCKISVIVPVYKVEKDLKRCIDSILMSSFKEFELILIDDGSPDESGTICDCYQELDIRVRVVHQSNQGVSAARNRGVQISKGEYISFIDGDDWIHPTYLERLYNCIVGEGTQIAICGYVETNGDYMTKEHLSTHNPILFDAREAISFLGKANLERKSAHFRSPWAKLIKREFVLKTPFPTDRTYAEDGACVYLWLWQADKIAVLDDVLYYYFQNDAGICHQPVRAHVIGNFLTEEEWIRFFKKHKFNELCKGFCRRYITDSMWAYKNSMDNESKELFRKVMRKGIHRYRRGAGLKFERITGYLEIVYPRLMKLFWFCKQQSSRWKR